MEGALLGGFMISACVFGVLYEFPDSPIRQVVTDAFVRRVLMGIAMGATAVVLIYSRWGKQSGAHMNPAVTLAFLRLGKIQPWDAVFYCLAQFVGAVIAVAVVAVLLSTYLADPAVRYVVTVPGSGGAWTAFTAEFLISAGMMAVVLTFSNHSSLSRYTGVAAGVLLLLYITLEAPYSGMSINPARTFGSAVLPGVWDSFWVYLTAPLLGMLAAAELYKFSCRSAHCAKLQHDTSRRCIFCGANGGIVA